MSSNAVVEPTAVADASVPSLTERIAKIEESLKELKRAAKQLEKQVGRRRRRTPRGQKGETPQQLRAWHEEVHRVWEDMKKTDKATLYKKAVAEAARRRGGKPVVADAPAAPAAPAAVTPVVTAPTKSTGPAKKVAKKN
jgi:DNA repair exonuclease SbcCD ATPase subunit